MRYAKIVSNDSTNGMIVSANDVAKGLYDKNGDFEDVEEEFRVTFVSSAKNHGVPYFRLYVSKDEYRTFSIEKKSRYDILRTMRHYQDGPWHKGWEEKVKSFADIESYFRNSEGICKRADAAIKIKQLIMEFQHSFISGDFQERNKFYSSLGMKVIWLFDVTQHNVIYENGYYKILEDNSRGFFKVEYNEGDLSKYYVYIQAKDGKIYRVKHLFRKNISLDSKSTIRYFYPDEIYTEEEFIDYLRTTAHLKTLYELWSPNYIAMVAYNHETNEYKKFYNDKKGNITRSFDTGCIAFQYASKNEITNYYVQNSNKFYSLSEKEANKPVWECKIAF